MRLLVILWLSLHSTGCANHEARSGVTAARSVHASDPFVPVNVFINPGTHVSSAHAEMLDHLYDALSASGAFAHTARGMHQGPFTLVIRYSYETPTTLKGLLMAVIFGGSLGVIPVQFPVTHHLRAEVVVGRVPGERLEYQVEASETAWLLRNPTARKDSRAAVDGLVARMIDDIAAKRLLPRVRELERLDAGDPEESI